jgi:hypothetical protein
MATFTPRLGLRKPNPAISIGDLVDAAGDLNANWDIIDAMGSISAICTTTTRPSSPVVGMMAYETDTTAKIICTSTGPSVWRYLSMPVAATLASTVTTPYTGLVGYQTSDSLHYKYNGSTWVPLSSGRIIFELKRTTVDNVTALQMMETGTVSIINGRKYRIDWECNHASNVGGPPNGSVHLRTASGASVTTAGTILRDSGLLINAATYQTFRFSTTYTAAATETRSFGISASSNGAPVITFDGGTTKRLFTITDVT